MADFHHVLSKRHCLLAIASIARTLPPYQRGESDAMGLLHLIILAIVQGITEFLPISSSAHLILAPQVLGDADQGPLIDVMAHLGTLFAVLVYFRADVVNVATGKLALLKGQITPGGKLALLIALYLRPTLELTVSIKAMAASKYFIL